MVYYRRRSAGFRRRSGYRRSSLPVRFRFGKNRFSRAAGYRRRIRRTSAPSMKWYNKKYNYKERFEENVVITVIPGQQQKLGMTMSGSQLPGWANRSVQADQYKIYKWKVEILPSRVQANSPVYDVTPASDTARFGQCRHALAVDYNDVSTGFSMTNMIDCPNAVIRPVESPIKMCIRPRLLKAAYETGVTSGQGYMPSTGWINTADSQVPHYGFKWIADMSQWHGTGEFTFIVRHTVYYGFKNTQSVH